MSLISKLLVEGSLLFGRQFLHSETPPYAGHVVVYPTADLENHVPYTGLLLMLDSRNNRKVEKNLRQRHPGSLFPAAADFRLGAEYRLTALSRLFVNRPVADSHQSDR